MIREHIDDNFHIIFGGGVEHGFHLLACADDGVADFPVGRLVVVVPVTFGAFVVEEFAGSAVGIVAMLHGRGLHHGVACVGNPCHVFGDCGEVPAPRMEDGFSVGGVGIVSDAILGSGRSCRQQRCGCKDEGEFFHDCSEGNAVKSLFNYVLNHKLQWSVQTASQKYE